MHPNDRIRFDLNTARRALPPGEARDGRVVGLLSDAMVEERRMCGAATEQALASRYGFSADELTRHGPAALDRATERYVAGNMVDPATA